MRKEKHGKSFLDLFGLAKTEKMHLLDCIASRFTYTITDTELIKL